MSLTKSYYDEELSILVIEDNDLNAMYYYEEERGKTLWINSLPKTTPKIYIDDYHLSSLDHFFCKMYEILMHNYLETSEYTTQIAQVDRNSLEDLGIWTSMFSIDTEQNRMDLIERNGDQI